MMNRRRILLSVIFATALTVTSCGSFQLGGGNDEQFIGENLEDVQIFPTLETSFVGDPMPFYDDGEFHVFYLEDLRDGKTGYHPWTLYETSNFYEYENKGQVIPYGETANDQDIALGTGCVIKDQSGLYHAFYTGHNDFYEPKEAIMHATSTDMENWTKIPGDMFYAEDHYAKNDFRDPYVLYVESEQQYWMLVSTRNDKTGVIARYTSKDLSTWKDEGIFFENDMNSDSNLECSSLLEYKGKWYLSFSDQWPNREFHYRVSDSMSGPFTIPEQDIVDGNGFYAGRLETDGENLYTFGWNGTKLHHTDEEDYDWAGNLVVHQLKQTENGDLVPVVNEQVEKRMKHSVRLTPQAMTESVKKKGNTYKFSGNKYEVVEFNRLRGSYMLKGKITNFKDSEKFGFAFNIVNDEAGKLNLVFDVKNNAVQFFNTDKLFEEDPQSEISLDMTNLDELDVTLLISDGVVSMYVNDQCAMTARMYASRGTTWGIFGVNASVSFEDLQIYK